MKLVTTKTILIAILVAVVAATANARTAAASTAHTDVPLQAGILGEINGVRSAHGLRRVHLSAGLRAAADSHSNEMARRGYFAHNSADGTPFWKRIERFYPRSSVRHWSVGENLLWAAPTVAPQRALKAWLASPAHRRILLDDSWREVGVSAVHATVAPGAFRGLEVTIVTADFGFRD